MCVILYCEQQHPPQNQALKMLITRHVIRTEKFMGTLTHTARDIKTRALYWSRIFPQVAFFRVRVILRDF